MIKIRVKDEASGERFVLLNPEAIVSVEEKEDNLFQVFLIDGRILYMTTEMFIEHFEEELEEKFS
jgi:hypothetical protein